MGEARVLYAIAESCPLDALLVRDMRRAVNALLQLNLKRFRVPQVELTKYSALDVMKQALELLYEFSPSEKNYREAMRTIQVYSEGDEEMVRTLQDSFRLIANAVYNTYSGQRHTEALAPQTLFLQGVPFEPNELQQSFRYVGVRPPVISPPSVKNTIFLDEGFEAYKLLMERKMPQKSAEKGREAHWAKIIEATLNRSNGTALVRAGTEHVQEPRSLVKKLSSKIQRSNTGRLPRILRQRGIKVQVIHQVEDVNEAYGKK